VKWWKPRVLNWTQSFHLSSASWWQRN